MTHRPRLTAALAALAVVAIVAAVAVARSGRRSPAGGDATPAIALDVGATPATPALWLDVHAPAEGWRALRANAWVARALAAPLGQGLGAEWAGFLATRGDDLLGAFEGRVLDLVADRLLADPFRVIVFGGPDATGAPAFVVPRPSAAADGAFALLERTARSGRYVAARCPGPPPPAGAAADPVSVSRWLLAEHALFAGRRDGRLALARSPAAVVQALCAAPPEVPAAPGIDLSLSFSRDALGREAQLAAALLGLGPAPRLAFAIEQDRLEPRGLLGELARPDRLGAGPPPRSLLALVPADTGVVLLATLRLPERLDRDTLRAHLAGGYRGPLAPRPVAVLWNPRGDASLPTEVAVLWPSADAPLLADAFSGPNRLERRDACGHVVLASTGALASAIQRSCAGAAPSVLQAAPAVAAGLGAPLSLELGVDTGRVLSRLLGDAHAAERDGAGRPRPAAPEIEDARRLLEELPYVGLRGVAEGGALVPGGFRS